MFPAHAPLPTASSLPFQPEAGSHTSILISESLDGVRVAATRQNGGSAAKGFPPRPPRGFGGVNCPAPTVCASVTTTCGPPPLCRAPARLAEAEGEGEGGENVDKLSHVAPIAGAANSTN